MLIADMSETEALIPLAAIFFIFGLPVIVWFAMRYMAHRERMEMIRQGFDPRGAGRAAQRAWQQQQPPTPPPVDDKSCSTYDYGYGYPNTGAQVALRKAIVIVAVGMALTIGLSFIGLDDGRFTPGPWLLGGLVPLFVGLAQVFSALAAGATLRPFSPAPRYYDPARGDAPPPPGAPPPQGGPPPPTGSYTYRPGVTPELRPPSPPVQRDN